MVAGLTRSPPPQRRGQLRLVDEPHRVLLAVQEHDRDVVGPPRPVGRVGIDVAHLDRDPGLASDPLDDRQRRLAQRAALPGEEGEQPRSPVPAQQPRPPQAQLPSRACFAASRSWPLLTLPVAECGSDSTNCTAVGHLNRASRAAQ